jgi:hypothetical protein
MELPVTDVREVIRKKFHRRVGLFVVLMWVGFVIRLANFSVGPKSARTWVEIGVCAALLLIGMCLWRYWCRLGKGGRAARNLELSKPVGGSFADPH